MTVVICTRDRAAALATTLGHYSSLWVDPDWSLVVVDDGSRDETAAILEAERRVVGDRFRILRTPGVGLGAARNAGWQAADGEVVFFTDDDCYPDPLILTAIRRHLTATGHDFVGGRLLPFRPEDAAVAVVTREGRLTLAGPQFVPAGLLPGANLAVRRAALEAVGGFDPEFGAGTPFPAEDVELVARLLASGFRGGYDPDLVVFHHHGRYTPAAREALERSYHRGRGAYYAKCLGDPRLRAIYRRAWVSGALRGSWARTLRELGGAWRYWARPRGDPNERSPRR
ncbi:MAG: glycosyltransferase family 2 protein [Gemmatimonadales bacterium]